MLTESAMHTFKLPFLSHRDHNGRYPTIPVRHSSVHCRQQNVQQSNHTGKQHKNKYNTSKKCSLQYALKFLWDGAFMVFTVGSNPEKLKPENIVQGLVQ